ncbi:ATP-dependent DNA helicase RecG [Candidatus Amesbacteria bacterium]|nr:ATP-dependent DNA helicase RecG [Candidatus Amesbacteria bacterium]
MKLSDNVTSLSGIGSVQAERLVKLEIYTVFDLLHHLPFRYEDRRIITPVSQIKAGFQITIVGAISEITNEYTKSGKVIQKTEIADETGKSLVIWFNQRYLARTIQAGTKISLYGKADWFGRKLAVISPEIADPETAGTIVPIYPETAGLTSKWLRKKIREVLDLNLLDESLGQNLRGVHFPNELYEIEKYRRNLAFNELLKFETENLKRRHDWQNRGVAKQFTNPKSQVTKFISDLPFKLTKSQNLAIEEILADLEKPVAMNRLLEGDVGSGKTVVAAVACLVAKLNGFKSLFMAPTQILALQHFETLSKLLSPFKISVGLVTSQTKSMGDVLVGTQALLNSNIDNVGLVIIDEQHKFGVAQRALLQHKGGTPHVLTMTATPIPRTMALVLYGDLDLSQLTELPAGRKIIKTWVVSEEKRVSAIEWIKKQKTQVFWICSLIDESESLKAIRAVNVEFESLKKSFSNLNLGLLHGRMKNKDEIINKFRDKKIDILVSTPVVEVGIDIPEASIMVIEDAHRFGLAALHQLRGRVGRNGQQAYCLMFSTQDTERLKAMETTHIGSRLAEIDLAIRGAGNIYSTSQHGKSELKIATYKDFDMLPLVRRTLSNLTLNPSP